MAWPAPAPASTHRPPAAGNIVRCSPGKPPTAIAAVVAIHVAPPAARLNGQPALGRLAWQREGKTGQGGDRHRPAHDRGPAHDDGDRVAGRARGVKDRIVGSERNSRRDVRRQQPQQHQEGGAERLEPAGVPVSAPQPASVDEQEQHGFGSHQRRQLEQHERQPLPSAQVSFGGPQDQRHRRRLDVAGQQVVKPVAAQQQRPDGRDTPDRAAQPAPEPEGQPDGRQSRGAGDDQPQRRRRPSGQRQRGGHQPRQGFPGRCPDRIQSQVHGLPAPGQPPERVIGPGSCPVRAPARPPRDHRPESRSVPPADGGTMPSPSHRRAA